MLKMYIYRKEIMGAYICTLAHFMIVYYYQCYR